MHTARCTLIAALMVFGTGAGGQQADLGPDAIAVLEQGIPKSGYVEVRFASEHGAGEFEAGFDAATGAWYWTNGDRALGFDTKGRIFAGDRRSVEYLDHPGDIDIQSWAYIFPFLATMYYVDNRADLASVAWMPGGVLRMTMKLDRGSRAINHMPAGVDPAPPMREWLEIGPDGRPLALWDDRLNERREFVYPPEVHAPFWVPDRALDQRLVLYTYLEHADPEMFAPDRVRARTAENAERTITALRTSQTSFAMLKAGNAPGASPRAPAAPSPTSSRTGPHTWSPSWPLLAGAGIVLGIATLIWWNRRK